MSVAGLLCAAVVPLLNRSKGGELLQFLISIAAGTLAGDAMIHLLPQALSFDRQTESESTPLFRATVTLFAIVLMYIIESVFTMSRNQHQVSLFFCCCSYIPKCYVLKVNALFRSSV